MAAAHSSASSRDTSSVQSEATIISDHKQICDHPIMTGHEFERYNKQK